MTRQQHNTIRREGPTISETSSCPSDSSAN
jgi:hypothetical protein